jgi:hypothetical protein
MLHSVVISKNVEDEVIVAKVQMVVAVVAVVWYVMRVRLTNTDHAPCDIVLSVESDANELVIAE